MFRRQTAATAKPPAGLTAAMFAAANQTPSPDADDLGFLNGTYAAVGRRTLCAEIAPKIEFDRAGRPSRLVLAADQVVNLKRGFGSSVDSSRCARITTSTDWSLDADRLTIVEHEDWTSISGGARIELKTVVTITATSATILREQRSPETRGAWKSEEAQFARRS